jgi:uncharacterized protein YndB with AHSA1/START domain
MDVAARHHETAERFEQKLVIAAPPEEIFTCFFSAEAIQVWWQAVRSVTTPVPFGVYAIEWPTTSYRDDLLGALGGVFHGTVVDVRPGRQFLVADAYWVPPEGEPLGPMVLEVGCSPYPDGCKLHVRQEGYAPSPRWRRYYAVVSRGWQVSLLALKRYAEKAPASAVAEPVNALDSGPAVKSNDEQSASGPIPETPSDANPGSEV